MAESSATARYADAQSPQRSASPPFAPSSTSTEGGLAFRTSPRDDSDSSATHLMTAAAATTAADTTATMTSAYEALLYNYKTSKGRAFLKDSAASHSTLPMLLPRGMPYVANFVSFDELRRRGQLRVRRDDEVSMTTDKLHLLYLAKCLDQHVVPSWQREVRFMELVSAHCKGNFFCLPENGLSIYSAQALAHILSTNKRYSVLDLGSNRLRDEGACALAGLLRVNCTLVHIGLSSNDIGYKGGIAIAQALQHNNTVVSLDLGTRAGINGNHIGTRGAAAVGELLRSNRVLARLNLASNGLGPAGLGLIAAGLRDNVVLTHLDISSNNLGHDGARALATLMGAVRLTSLSVQRNSLGDAGGALLFNAIADAIEAGGGGGGAGSSSTSSNHHHNNNSSAGTTGSGGGGAGGGGGFCGDVLEVLDVAHNDLGVRAARAVRRVLTSSQTLRRLCLAGNPLTAAVTHVAEGMCDNRGVAVLDLTACDIRAGEAAAALGKMLATNHTLTTLLLAQNKLRDQGAREVARGVAVNTALLRLDLSSNKIADDGGAAIAASVLSNTTLRELNVRRNDMTASTGDALNEQLRSNTTIERMDVTYNDFSYKCFVGIQATLARNAQNNKQLVVPRLNAEIEQLAPKEKELAQVEELIELEKRVIRDRSEQLVRRNEEARVVVEKMRRDVAELEKTLEGVRAASEAAEAAYRRVEDHVSADTAALKTKKTGMETRIQHERDRQERLLREMERMRRQIAQLESADKERLAPLYAEVQRAEEDCARDRDSATFEAEKLAGVELRCKELEIMLSKSGKRQR